ncbi:MAG: preprotein translocase subunit SecA [Chloroflexi bacterium]|nr:preprotein translocase subunit SecA [Chloroflexota bacterium]
MLGWVNKLLGGRPWEREVKKIEPLIDEINDFEPELQDLTDAELRDKTTELRGRLLAGEDLDSLLPEAFASVREAARRVIGMRHYDVQMIGGAILHRGKIAEMKTGEGKTLVATLPVYLNALTGKGVHLVTTNDYLARRDAQWMGQVYHALGMSIGVIQHESAFIYDPEYQAEEASMMALRPAEHRREAYAADITYGTNNEFGFDYLRDNMVWRKEDMVQRDLHYAIVDEVDNILIDEARTPLIISGPAEEATDYYAQFARIVPRLREEDDFTIEQRTRSLQITEEGIEKVERMLGVQNLYAPENMELSHYLENAMKAQFLFQRDDHYVVQDGEIVIVDEFTGRMMPGRRYSEGLHQAIEAKEGVHVQRENVTLARITFQNYFRLYSKLGGMTGTAMTELDEFRRIYNLDVVPIPTHRPMIRQDNSDFVFKSEDAKLKAVVNEIRELNETGRPVLVGTVSIEKSELLSHRLVEAGVKHDVLNAKQHEREANIIAQAGRPSAVTIATNMAGRGVDILLGGNPAGLADDMLRKQGVDRTTATHEQIAAATAEANEICQRDREVVRSLGGLHILGTERHEARRIDNQLRGRAGRQGDPGSSRFFVSLEDELMKRFGGSSIAGLMDKLGLEEDVPLEHSWVNKAIENAQTKVEAYNFDIRKHVVEYDDVMNKQREVIYADRKQVLTQENLRPMIESWVVEELDGLIDAYLPHEDTANWDHEGLLAELRKLLPLAETVSAEELEDFRRDELIERLRTMAVEIYTARETQFTPGLMRMLEQQWMLNVIDRHWINHLTAIDDVRDGIGLRAYGQRDPLVEYKVEAASMFDDLLETIRHDVVYAIYHIAPRLEPVRRTQPTTTNREDEEDGKQPVKAGKKVGRNDPCPCGSGRKFKKCHGR